MLLCPYLTRETYNDNPGEPMYRRIETTDENDNPYVLHLTNNAKSYTLTLNPTECRKDACAAWQNGRCVRIS